MKIKPMFAWYDLWVGAFWSKSSRTLYLFPIPMFGFAIKFAPKATTKVAP